MGISDLIPLAKQQVPALALHHKPDSKSKERNKQGLLLLLFITLLLLPLYGLQYIAGTLDLYTITTLTHSVFHPYVLTLE